MEPNALLKTILTSARVPQGSLVLRAPKTLRNVQPTNPAYTENASTHMGHMRKYCNHVLLFSKMCFYLVIWYTSCGVSERVHETSVHIPTFVIS